MHVSRARVYAPNSSLHLEAAWHPERDFSWAYTLHGLESLQRQDELEAAWHGEWLLRAYAPARPGRPPGGTMDDYSLDELKDKFRLQQSHNRREHLKGPTLEQFATLFRVDRRRVRDRLHVLGFPDWKAFVRACQ